MIQKKIILLLLSFVMCLSVVSSLSPIFAATVDASAERIVWKEDFSNGANTSDRDNDIKANKGFWAKASGSTVTTTSGTLKYTQKSDEDFVDIRVQSMYDAELNLKQDFIFAFKAKTSDSAVLNLGRFTWWGSDEGASGTGGYESNQLQISGNKFYTYVSSSTEKALANYSANQWVLVEIAFNYDEDAVPDYKTTDSTMSNGAIVSYTVMLNGVELYTQECAKKFQNIDFFRCFRYGGTNPFEVDDICIALGSESLIDVTDLESGDTEPDIPQEDDNAEQTILFKQDFSGDTVNTSGSEAAVTAANGLFVCNENGSTYTLDDGTLKYTDRLSFDYVDLRFYYNGTKQNLSKDFILSFKLKPNMPSIAMQFAWKDNNHTAFEENVRIANGRFRINGRSYGDCVLKEDEWALVEIAFHYNANARAVTGELGAVDSYTVTVNGKAVATVDAKLKFHNISLFRLFRYSTCEFEIDDLIVATKNDSLDKDGSFSDWTPKVYYFDKESVNDYAYSFCIVGDTQKVTKHASGELIDIYDWITANAESKKIKYVFGLGDITDTDTDSEWNTAYDAITTLNNVVPYSVIRGNHDGSENINRYFFNDDYTGNFGGFYGEGSMENSWRKITVGDVKYLLITLDFGAKDEVLEWAGDIIESYPDHRVIISTHTYLYADGTTVDAHDSGAPSIGGDEFNNGDEMWDKLISKYENIFLVLSGHIESDYVITTQSVGEHGNVVTQMLVNPQGVDGDLGATGMISMLYFSEDGKTIAVETYSTVNQNFFLEENQYTIDIASWSDSESQEHKPSEDDGNINNGSTDNTQNSENTDSVQDSDTDIGETATTTEEQQTDKGCGSNICGRSLVMIIAVLILGCVLASKRKLTKAKNK